jgi:hypothetical protein
MDKEVSVHFMMWYIIGYLLPGAGMIVLAFVAGSQKNPALGLLSFLCFFVIGVTLVLEGWRRVKKK